MQFLRLPILSLHVMVKAGRWHRCHILAVIAIIPIFATTCYCTQCFGGIEQPHLNTTTNSVLFLTGILAFGHDFGPTDCQYRTTWWFNAGGCLRIFCKTVCVALCRIFFIFDRRKHSSNQSDVSKTFHEVQLLVFPILLDSNLLAAAIICLPPVPCRCGRIA
jgi:hypothetical protein